MTHQASGFVLKLNGDIQQIWMSPFLLLKTQD